MRCLHTVNGKIMTLLLGAVVVPVVVAMLGVSTLILQQRHQYALHDLERGLRAFDHELTAQAQRLDQALAALTQRPQIAAVADLFHRYGGSAEATAMLELEAKRLQSLLADQALAAGVGRVTLLDAQGRPLASYGRGAAAAWPPPTASAPAAELRLQRHADGLLLEARQPLLRADWQRPEGATTLIGHAVAQHLFSEAQLLQLTRQTGVELSLLWSPEEMAPVGRGGISTAYRPGQLPAISSRYRLTQPEHVALPLPLADAGDGLLLARLPGPGPLREIAGVHLLFIGLLLAAVALVLPVSLWSARRLIGDPVQRLVRAAERIAGGDYRHHVQPAASTELRRLTSAFNVMIDAVQTREAALHSSEQRFQYLAWHDPLTSLPNRAGVEEALHAALAQANQSGDQVAVLFFDLDRFAEVNDTLGHPAGDQLLHELAGRLRECRADYAELGRMGGDEFLVILQPADEASALTLAQRLLTVVARPFRVAGEEVEIGASVGIALYPEHGTTAPQLIQAADIAMYRAKAAGGHCARVCTPAMMHGVRRRFELDGALRRAVEHAEFSVAFQPQVWLADGSTYGLEALVRWQPPQGPAVPPGDFIPLAEETGLILPIGEQVLQLACERFQGWLAAGFPLESLSVNLSSRQLQDAGIVATVERALRRSGLPPQRLVLEVTESMIMHDRDRSVRVLQRLRELGVELALDDFGTGHSSLSYLRQFPLNELKIDRSFINDCDRGHSGSAIARAIIALGRALDLRLIAEGIETPAQREFLLRNGCLRGQGFFYHRPLSDGQVEHLLGSSRLSSAASGG